MNLSQIKGIKVDKHSTGGVGDKTTLVLGPLVASAGVPVAKMSGRGLGHTGGTLDKLESIEGFNVLLDMEEFINNVNNINIAVIGQTADLAPADKKLYALRDVTGTVDNIPLIASSIMSKKIAAGADAIVLDVKTGSGAFMKNLDDAFALAREMVDIGTNLNKDVVALITEMNEPLGYAVGNALEVKEAIATLKGHGPEDLTNLCVELGSIMLVLGGRTKDRDEARQILRSNISSGAALEKLIDMVKAQNGNPEMILNPELLPAAKHVLEIKSEKEGYVEGIDAEGIGIAGLILGAGRETKESGVDWSVGVVLVKKYGEYVKVGETLAYIHVNDMSKVEDCKAKILGSYKYTDQKPTDRPLIFGMVDKENSIKF